MTVFLGETGKITADVFPVYPGGEIAWKSSAPGVASVSGGVVTALSSGTATVTVTSGRASAACAVTVRARNTFILPTSVTAVSAEAFLNTPCEYVVIPSSCTSIASRAFANAGDIALYMPDSVTDIAGDAFEGCGKVTFICESDNTAAAYAVEKGFDYRIEQIQ